MQIIEKLTYIFKIFLKDSTIPIRHFIGLRPIISNEIKPDFIFHFTVSLRLRSWHRTLRYYAEIKCFDASMEYTQNIPVCSQRTIQAKGTLMLWLPLPEHKKPKWLSRLPCCRVRSWLLAPFPSTTGLVVVRIISCRLFYPSSRRKEAGARREAARSSSRDPKLFYIWGMVRRVPGFLGAKQISLVVVIVAHCLVELLVRAAYASIQYPETCILHPGSPNRGCLSLYTLKSLATLA